MKKQKKTTFTKWKLTIREYTVFIGIAENKTTKQMSADMKLSPKTVGTYRERLKKKTGLKNNVEIVLYYERNKGEFKERSAVC